MKWLSEHLKPYITREVQRRAMRIYGRLETCDICGEAAPYMYQEYAGIMNACIPCNDIVNIYFESGVDAAICTPEHKLETLGRLKLQLLNRIELISPSTRQPKNPEYIYNIVYNTPLHYALLQYLSITVSRMEKHIGAYNLPIAYVHNYIRHILAEHGQLYEGDNLATIYALNVFGETHHLSIDQLMTPPTYPSVHAIKDTPTGESGTLNGANGDVLSNSLNGGNGGNQSNSLNGNNSTLSSTGKGSNPLSLNRGIDSPSSTTGNGDGLSNSIGGSNKGVAIDSISNTVDVKLGGRPVMTMDVLKNPHVTVGTSSLVVDNTLDTKETVYPAVLPGEEDALSDSVGSNTGGLYHKGSNLNHLIQYIDDGPGAAFCEKRWAVTDWIIEYFCDFYGAEWPTDPQLVIDIQLYASGFTETVTPGFPKGFLENEIDRAFYSFPLPSYMVVINENHRRATLNLLGIELRDGHFVRKMPVEMVTGYMDANRNIRGEGQPTITQDEYMEYTVYHEYTNVTYF